MAIAAALAGRPSRELLLVLCTVLVGQVILGWFNDLVDRARDARHQRTDKPLADGRLDPGTVWFCLALAVFLVVPLSIVPQLVAHLREHRAKLRAGVGDRIHEAHLLEAMTPQEMAAETTSVYDNYVEVLETGSVEALQHYARDLSERIIPRGVETHEVVGIVLLLRDVLARSLFEKYQRTSPCSTGCSTPTSPRRTGSPTPWRSASSRSASGSSGSSRTRSASCPPRCCRSANDC